MITNFEVRERIRKILINCRKEKDITQSQLAIILNIPKTTIASWEQGLSLPSVDMLYRLAKYYNKSMDYMYGDEK